MEGKNETRSMPTGPMIREVKGLPVVSFAFVISLISLILTFIAGVIWFIIGYSTLHRVSTHIIALNNNTTAIVHSVGNSITAMGAIYLIILWPIMTFIGTFIVAAIIALLYNFLAPRVGGIKLKLE